MTSPSTFEIVLDESGANASEAGFVPIGAEIDFVRNEGLGTTKLWVSGPLCRWVRDLYRVRKGHCVSIRELESPHARLKRRFGVDSDVIDEKVLDQITRAIDEEQANSLAELLRHLTSDDVWSGEPSVKHAARWLLTDFDPRLAPLVEVQRSRWGKAAAETPALQRVYDCSLAERETYLRKWLLDKEVENALGTFPLVLPKLHAEFVTAEVGQLLRATNGSAVLDLPRRSPNAGAYAAAVTEFFAHNPGELDSKYLAHVSLLLNAEQRASLQKTIHFAAIEPLKAAASYQEALDWATRSYLPLRQAELDAEGEHQKGDELATSFATWLLNNYPGLTSCDAAESPINIRAHHLVKELAQGHWVLWVVVDGLNFLDHQKLLGFLGKHSQLRLESDAAVLAVLPTITKRAKFCLTTGQFAAQRLGIEEDPQKVFLESFPSGVYGGEAGFSKLKKGLNTDQPSVSYWNFTQVDKHYHSHTDLHAAVNEVESTLEALAKNIALLVGQAKDPSRVAVVVCSDHGQMLRPCRLLKVERKNVTFDHGRTVFGHIGDVNDDTGEDYLVSGDEETVFLNPKSFRLHEPTTVALREGYFVNWGANTPTAIGVHGGLFPEETVLGLSVLGLQPVRHALNVHVTGNGESGKPGTVTVSIDNPNPAAVRVLSLSVPGLEFTDQTVLVDATVPAQQRRLFEIPIDVFPAQDKEMEFVVAGELSFAFMDGVVEACSVSGRLSCKTLYTTKNPSLNRFKK